MNKKEKLAKLLLTFITANMLFESLDDDLLDKGLFQRATKYNAKNLADCLKKDITPLYERLQTPESIEGYTDIFNLIGNSIKDIIEETIKNIQETD